MSVNIVLCAMEEGKQYLPELVPCTLAKSTKAAYLRELWRGGIVEREKIELEGVEDGRKKTRFAYTSRQKKLDL